MIQFGTPGISAIGIRTIDETRGADVRAITFVSACCSTGGFGSLVQPLKERTRLVRLTDDHV